MNENQGGSNNLLDTTDCLEAVGVFKGWKNFLFVLVLICILLLQVCFWLVDTGLIEVPADAKAAMGGEYQISLMPVIVEPEQDITGDINVAGQEIPPELNIAAEPNQPVEPNQVTEPNQPAVPVGAVDSNQPATTDEAVMDTSIEPEEAIAETVAPEPPQPAEVQETGDFLFGITFDHLVWVMRFANAVLILTATIYCLTILFSLKVSMLGRLGGINHITRAFFLSLLALVLLLPWQKVFDSVVFGAVFAPDEMVEWLSARTENILDIIIYYLRFCGFWLLILLLLILAQIRSSRWAGAILRRLEII